MINMVKILHHLFLPRHSNNHKARLLHHSSLVILLIIVVGFQSGLSLLTRFTPGVLGYASNISIERLLELTNEQRQNSGLTALALNQQLSQAAQQKASVMFTFGCWAHNCNGKTPWWYFKNVNYNYLYAGENLARDFGDSEGVLEAWMESPTHKDNILNGKYREIGFAVVNGVLNGEETTLVVQLFGTSQGAPAILSGQEQAQPVETRESQAQILVSQPVTPVQKPWLSTFSLTKDFYLLLISLLAGVLAVDTFLIYQRRTVRISGKSFIHLSFFIIILISIFMSYPGQIL